MSSFSTIEVVMVSMNNVNDFKKSIQGIGNLLNGYCRIIVVDSSSTTDILEESNYLMDSGVDILYKWEQPQGIYHAMNTGVKFCKDEALIWFLNPGDLVTDSALVIELVELINRGKFEWGFGLASYETESLVEQRLFPSIVENSVQNLFNGELQISHQSMLVRKAVIMRFGLFDTKFHIAADLDFQFKLLEAYSPAVLPRHLIVIDTKGASHTQQFRTFFESFMIRLSRQEFSALDKLLWLTRWVTRRMKSSRRLRFRNAN